MSDNQPQDHGGWVRCPDPVQEYHVVQEPRRIADTQIPINRPTEQQLRDIFVPELAQGVERAPIRAEWITPVTRQPHSPPPNPTTGQLHVDAAGIHWVWNGSAWTWARELGTPVDGLNTTTPQTAGWVRGAVMRGPDGYLSFDGRGWRSDALIQPDDAHVGAMNAYRNAVRSLGLPETPTEYARDASERCWTWVMFSRMWVRWYGEEGAITTPTPATPPATFEELDRAQDMQELAGGSPPPQVHPTASMVTWDELGEPHPSSLIHHFGDFPRLPFPGQIHHDSTGAAWEWCLESQWWRRVPTNDINRTAPAGMPGFPESPYFGMQFIRDNGSRWRWDGFEWLLCSLGTPAQPSVVNQVRRPIAECSLREPGGSVPTAAELANLLGPPDTPGVDRDPTQPQPLTSHFNLTVTRNHNGDLSSPVVNITYRNAGVWERLRVASLISDWARSEISHLEAAIADQNSPSLNPPHAH